VNDEPLANLDFELEVDGVVTTGKTDADGGIEIGIPGNARKGTLRVHDEGFTHEFDLGLGNLDPIGTLTGVQQRLKNLGFDCGPADGRMGPRTRAALEKFQAKHELPVTGEVDKATRSKIEEAHES
jgi:N-acetylmuramoyl-L-alanine amidase